MKNTAAPEVTFVPFHAAACEVESARLQSEQDFGATWHHPCDQPIGYPVDGSSPLIPLCYGLVKSAEDVEAPGRARLDAGALPADREESRMNLWRTKTIEQSIRDTEEPTHKLRKQLGAIDLTVF